MRDAGDAGESRISYSPVLRDLLLAGSPFTDYAYARDGNGANSFGFRTLWSPVFGRNGHAQEMRARVSESNSDSRQICGPMIDVDNSATYFLIGRQILDT
jgi:hypothetical protein